MLSLLHPCSAIESSFLLPSSNNVQVRLCSSAAVGVVSNSFLPCFTINSPFPFLPFICVCVWGNSSSFFLLPSCSSAQDLLLLAPSLLCHAEIV
ncbi:uncharacterized protein LOC129289812 isoform X2 [Prosopis cineraria]|uniref:uncharacterized protein LOC129289812 isoform X2 n=1 Tax=Prosopis cineraria TaxID=364024 RepID=UPI00241089B6|nr:uncharacterized protein LOC129289812 isoform X2 [Prosopis cineraria]